MKKRVYGIYAVVINDRYYIGKDQSIEERKRIKEHLKLLKKGEHYNRYLQRAYNKYEKAETYILAKYENISGKELSIIEQRFIQKYDSYKNGYNLTLGGEGGLGLVISEEEKKKRSLRTTGELNPAAKLTNNQFFEVVELFMQGKSNKFIGELYGLHDRYVSLIRHKHRFKSLWELVGNYNPLKSNEVAEKLGSITESEFIEIVNEMLEGKTNAEIEESHVLSGGTASRIRNQKLYKTWWAKHFKDIEDINAKIKLVHKEAVKRKLQENGSKNGRRKISDITREKMKRNNSRNKMVSIDNIRYSSLTEAERKTGINRKIIAKRVKDSLYPNYIELDKNVFNENKLTINSRKSKKISIDGIEYPSISAASRQLKISNRTISDRVKNDTFSNYRYLGEGENPLSKNARKVIIDGQEYRSMNYAATQLNIDKNYLTRMLKDENYINYKYVEEAPSIILCK